MSARHIVKVWLETSYGVFANPVSPVKGVDYIVINLTEDNSFNLRTKPKQDQIRSQAFRNRLSQMVQTQAPVEGSLNTLLYPEQAKFLFDWMSKLTSDQSVSCTVDEAILMANGTVTYNRFLGVKVKTGAITASKSQNLVKLALSLIGQKPASPAITVTDFPAPAATEYPSGVPFCFTHLATPGYVTLSSGRTEFTELDLTIENNLDPLFSESQYISRCDWHGRSFTGKTTLVYKNATDRSLFEAVPQISTALSFKFDDGTNGLEIDLGTNNYVTDVSDTLPLGTTFMQSLSFENGFDVTGSTDFTVTVTP